MVYNEQLVETLKDIDSEILARVIDKLDEAYHHDKIYVGDGDDNCDRTYELSHDGNGLAVFLTIEEDGEVNWYFHPSQHGDLAVMVQYIKHELAEQE
jgi:hypothetical protein